ncbi:tetratricopeptide repeat protein [Niabella insulamsoli]|uniref:tetratricopeptide repeat protein n=1 Tax=Niabella insulamsoli TaxID=3144874 RepID=UPI0031FCBBD3
MKAYTFIIRYRLPIAIVVLLAGIFTNYAASFWPAFPLYLIAAILIFSHFFFGPLRLIQEYMETGDMEGAEKILNSIKFPNLLYKPIRSVYYTLKGNIAMSKQDFDGAESMMKKGLDLGMPMKEAEGASMLQMGMLAMQKGNIKQGESYIRQAIRKGLPDKENEAAAFLQMCSIMMNKREFRAAKDFYRKAKACNPTTPQIVEQLKEIGKYISRMPG